ncbi:hypothetical protein GYMLUDRAFT_248938 [Collybiopsis luxurians FD-317 M1]|uniref:Uncharacterized protein n=1 Tax=Collybiopsis luxurians FD-317 M1 TaxID=944289 RepID=A0A0D0CAS6_9AGAR|nr:hypothetical protein GYMLUDRAFT_248938 [Collybiopsis luxurians FD-317 M1]
MFTFGKRKPKIPTVWPSLHHKCNVRKCTFPNTPQSVPGKYKCRGCEKGTYSVSQAQAQQASMKGFYVPGCSHPLNPRAQLLDLNQLLDRNQGFPDYFQADTFQRPQVSRAKMAPNPQHTPVPSRDFQVSNGYAHAPDVYHRDGFYDRAPPAKNAYNRGLRPNARQQMYPPSATGTSQSSEPCSRFSVSTVEETKPRSKRRRYIMNA